MGRYILKATKNDKIFWSKNSVDKPSQIFLDTHIIGVNNASKWETLGEYTPNYINQFNATVTVDSDKYTYFELTDTQDNSVKYFLVDSINKILKNGFVLDLTLDIYVTYTIPFLNNYLNDKPILVNRTSESRLHTYNYKALLSPDPLINTTNWPLAHVPLKSRTVSGGNTITTTLLTANPKCAFSRLKNQNTEHEWWIRSSNNVRINGINGVFYKVSGVFCDLYLTDDGYYFLVPLLDNSEGSANISGMDIDNSVPFQMKNNSAALDQMRKNGFWINKFKGRFFLPFWFWLLNFGWRWHFIENTIQSVVTYLLAFELQVPHLDIPIDRRYCPTFDIGQGDIMEFDTQINPKGEVPNIYIKSKTCQLENDTPLFFMDTRSDHTYLIPFTLNFSGSMYNFKLLIDTTKGYEWYYNRMEFDLGFSVSGFSTLPITTSSYLSYLSSVSSSTAANLAAAKQQMLLGVTQMGMGGANNIISSIGNGLNPMGGIISTGFGITNKILQYQNQEKAIQANKADKQRSATPNQFLPTNYKDNYANTSAFSSTRAVGQDYALNNFDSIVVKTIYKDNNLSPGIYSPGTNLIEYYNNLIWQVGYYINDYVNFAEYYRKFNITIKIDYDTFNPFIYWDIEIPQQYVLNYYPLFNKELQEAILVTINQPIRIWKETTPDYTIPLIYRQRTIEY